MILGLESFITLKKNGLWKLLHLCKTKGLLVGFTHGFAINFQAVNAVTVEVGRWEDIEIIPCR